MTDSPDAAPQPLPRPPRPTPGTRWRCAACGNLTRFDVVRSSRVREYWHLDLSGEPTIEESTALEESVEEVTCRWCGGVDTVELVARPQADHPVGPGSVGPSA